MVIFFISVILLFYPDMFTMMNSLNIFLSAFICVDLWLFLHPHLSALICGYFFICVYLCSSVVKIIYLR